MEYSSGEEEPIFSTDSLRIAALEGNKELLQLVCSEMPSLLHKTNVELNQSPFVIAMRNDHIEVASYLAEAEPTIVTKNFDDSSTLVHKAVTDHPWREPVRKMMQLVDIEQRYQLVTKSDGRDLSPLALAYLWQLESRTEAEEAVNFLLEGLDLQFLLLDLLDRKDRMSIQAVMKFSKSIGDNLWELVLGESYRQLKEINDLNDVVSMDIDELVFRFEIMWGTTDLHLGNCKMLLKSFNLLTVVKNTLEYIEAKFAIHEPEFEGLEKLRKLANCCFNIVANFAECCDADLRVAIISDTELCEDVIRWHEATAGNDTKNFPIPPYVPGVLLMLLAHDLATGVSLKGPLVKRVDDMLHRAVPFLMRKAESSEMKSEDAPGFNMETFEKLLIPKRGIAPLPGVTEFALWLLYFCVDGNDEQVRALSKTPTLHTKILRISRLTSKDDEQAREIALKILDLIKPIKN